MHSKAPTNSWLRESSGRRYESWCGYAFESICFKHADAIRAAIGIADVQTQLASWRYAAKPGSDEEGAQIDLLIDRADRCINICEIKYSPVPTWSPRAMQRNSDANCASSAAIRPQADVVPHHDHARGNQAESIHRRVSDQSSSIERPVCDEMTYM